ncbi:MAG TPA: tetratricopeptide repeat protein, partial [Blastocatellia bacterium]|nr:tetratricopeptide repeat protein [Blastocatellia bacterium]
MLRNLSISLFVAMSLSGLALAQEVDVDRYNINAHIDAAAGSMEAQATLSLSNPASTSKSVIYLRLSKKATVSQVTIDGAKAQYEVTDDHRFTMLNQIMITLASGIQPGGHANVTVAYKLDASQLTPILAIYPGEVLLLPEAVWFPAPSSVFAIYGPNTAPCALNVTLTPGGGDFKAVTGGDAGSGAGQSFSFDEKLNSLPFLVAGNFDRPVVTEHGGVKIALYLQPGLTSESDGAASATTTAQPTDPGGKSAPGGQQSTRLVDEAGRIIDFLTKTLGPPPAGATFTVISSVNAGNFSVPGALLLNEQVFQQDMLDGTTVEVLADALARTWLDGRVRLRGQDSRSADADHPGERARSAAFLRDSLPRYLAVLYFEERFGTDASRAAFARMRAAYAPVARTHTDSELVIQTLLNATYADAVFSKGPLVLRLLAHTAGQDKLLEVVRHLFTGPPTKLVRPDDFTAAFGSDPAIRKVFKDWVDSRLAPDLLIGQPLQTGNPNVQQLNLRNLGTGEIPTTVLAVTASGKRLTVPVTVPPEDLTSIEIPTGEKIVSVEVDPDKYYIQTNFDNDAYPARKPASSLLNEGVVAFDKGQYGEAVSKLREALTGDPNNSVLHAWLARALYGEKPPDEAAKEAAVAIAAQPPFAPALSWAYIT